ncbi:MAG TPA: tagaturonate reductase [Puia sp.]|nr:tagaturonate reductase [Puia sp.]
MNLSKDNLSTIKTPGVILPGKDIFTLPEKVLQFGTGVLLRGLPDYFIDKANRQGVFNGRVVVVKSTDSGGADSFDRQDSLYTLCIRGIEQGKKVEENVICSAISRVLSAKGQWQEILQCAHNPEMQVIISNTTEVGIQLVEADIDFRSQTPISFPGKLLAFLYERYHAFGGSPESGMVIVPTELIVDNGKKLAAIVKELAVRNKLEEGFVAWMERDCRFCSSLVDRIVPGKPDAATLAQLHQDLGYTDDLLAISEVYRLWAIEGDEKVQAVLSFAKADAGVIIRKDIEIFRELKLRLLNGTHTLSCGLAFLSGFATVRNAMDDAAFAAFVTDLMLKEIAPAIPYTLPLQEAQDFGMQVLDRFRNPHIQHQWISITMQYSSKMKMRNIPVLLQHYTVQDTPPPHLSLGFAAYLLFMRAVKKEADGYKGEYRGKAYPINDDKAGIYFELWKDGTPETVVNRALKDEGLWGSDLTALKGFEASVKADLLTLIDKGAIAALAQKKSTVKL